MRTHQINNRESVTPNLALTFLKEGNQRFVKNLKLNRNLLEQVNETKDGQFPFAVILSCIDSRTSAELIFDQGLGDIFSIRIAGNVINEDIIGSMEFSCKLAGSKLVVVMGHSRCGAITGACKKVELGYLTNLLDKITPSITHTKSMYNDLDISSSAGVDLVARRHIEYTIKEVLNKSKVLREMYDNNEINIIGAFYNVESGIVDFIEK
ncbi:carbonic anhydrase [Sphingobacterium sp. N143]|uniref:carbonic anhydrase family protein n=1 Tax=Sphingobacterium sp. N143 TaxID=2746727 RepID=UPI002576DECD|nr:carbonic anhydrase family protein [Sphingobacterium sp. N143]MDM1294955.1 carbonic anhydrase [Sphingobacterium sp. N143]